MKRNRILTTIASLTLVLAMAAGVIFPYMAADAATKPTSIKITSNKKEVEVSKNLNLKVSYSPKKAKSKITWSSSDKGVATVNKKGVVTGKKAGTATITAKTANNKTASVTITVKSSGKYSAGTVLWDQSKSKKASDKTVVRTYEQYKYHVSAIWLLPYNLYASGEAVKDPLHGPANNVKGLRLKLTGEYKMDGSDAEELLLQMNYTQPKAYPIVWQTDKKKGPVKGGKWYKISVEFNVPETAINGDKDGNYTPSINWPILLYFANKPNNKMSYSKGNDFTFRNFKLTVVGNATDKKEIKQKPALPK